MAIWHAFLTILGLAACGAPPTSSPWGVAIAPISELSGLAILAQGEEEFLLAVGDEAYELLVMPLGRGEVVGAPDLGRAFTIPLPLPRSKAGSELEGVAVDPQGRVAVLSEPGEVTHLRVELARREAVPERTLPVVFAKGHPLAEAWQRDPNARAEGLAFVAGRVFIVKQRQPAALVELKEREGAYHAEAVWTLSLEDASDLAVGPDGALWVVGGRAELLCRLATPAGAGGDLACERSARLPGKLEGKKARWEGLAVRGEVVYLGADHKKDRPNLAVFPKP